MTAIKDIPVEKGEAVWIVDKETNKVTDALIVRKKEKTIQQKLHENLSLVMVGLIIVSTTLIVIINYKKYNGE